MPSLYFTSLTAGAGRTTLAAAATALLASRGKPARYLKPVTFREGQDPDAAFCRAALGEGRSAGEPQRAPGPLTEGLGALSAAFQKQVTSAAGSTLVIDGLPAAGETARASAEMAGLAQADVFGVVRYRRNLDIGAVGTLRDLFRDRLRGVVLNAVPEVSLRAAREETAPALERAGLKVLGIIPEDRLLLGFTVADYSARLGGRFMNHEELGGRIVENILVGANSLDPGELYYERVPNKALITRGDRPDLQFSALNTSTRCLILTQGVEPIPYILDHAVAQEVPVVVVPEGTLATVAAIESFVGQPTFHHPDKLSRAVELLDTHLDKGVLGL